MTIDECVESWVNGNLSTVIDHVISRPTAASVAYYAAAISSRLAAEADDDPIIFLNLLSSRIYTSD